MKFIVGRNNFAKVVKPLLLVMVFLYSLEAAFSESRRRPGESAASEDPAIDEAAENGARSGAEPLSGPRRRTAGSGAVYDEKNICTLTLNSADEVETVKRTLNETRNSAERHPFKMTELVPVENEASNPFIAQRIDWLKDVCTRFDTVHDSHASKCDMLLVSAHFAGYFFSLQQGRNFRLPIRKLLKHACSGKCDGIFRSPELVALFACNTLNEKGKGRTVKEYRAALQSDNLRPDEIDEAIILRYGPGGFDSRSIFHSAFRNSEIRGFTEKAPTGRQLTAVSGSNPKEKNPLERYFDSMAQSPGGIPGYLTQLSGKRIMNNAIHSGALSQAARIGSYPPNLFCPDDRLSSESKGWMNLAANTLSIHPASAASENFERLCRFFGGDIKKQMATYLEVVQGPQIAANETAGALARFLTDLDSEVVNGSLTKEEAAEFRSKLPSLASVDFRKGVDVLASRYTLLGVSKDESQRDEAFTREADRLRALKAALGGTD